MLNFVKIAKDTYVIPERVDAVYRPPFWKTAVVRVGESCLDSDYSVEETLRILGLDKGGFGK